MPPPSEMDRGVRINAVSPPFLRETLQAMGMDRSLGIPAPNVAPAYRESVEGNRTGEVLDPRDFVPVAHSVKPWLRRRQEEDSPEPRPRRHARSLSTGRGGAELE